MEARVTPATTSRVAVFRLKGRRLLKKTGRIAMHRKLLTPQASRGPALFSNLFAAQTEVFPNFGQTG